MQYIYYLVISFSLIITSCSAQQTARSVEMEPVWVTGNSTSKNVYGNGYSLELNYQSMNEGDFIFGISCKNVTTEDIILACDSSSLEVEGCSENFELLLNNYPTKLINIPSNEIVKLRLKFKPINDFALKCSLSANRIVLSGLTLIIAGERKEIMSMAFEPSMQFLNGK